MDKPQAGTVTISDLLNANQITMLERSMRDKDTRLGIGPRMAIKAIIKQWRQEQAAVTLAVVRAGKGEQHG